MTTREGGCGFLNIYYIQLKIRICIVYVCLSGNFFLVNISWQKLVNWSAYNGFMMIFPKKNVKLIILLVLQITDECLPSISELQHLEDLVLEGCFGIDDSSLEVLRHGCKSLKVLIDGWLVKFDTCHISSIFKGSSGTPSKFDGLFLESWSRLKLPKITQAHTYYAYVRTHAHNRY